MSFPFNPKPHKDYDMLLNQFNSLVQLVNTLERTQHTLNKNLSSANAELSFLRSIMDDISEVVPNTSGHCFHNDLHYNSIEELFNCVLGIEFGGGR